eukprot:TRINITY_DN16707_c0_g1_i1.p1 TRINITY_DN16707_c0_g1~~TRINITY_DN16707_c0_g1_i1.p1  ORF type:complete len:503 (+),score=168.64 TRINITY_DN16707_c0_g1_i1:45-1553(+)
MLRHSRGLLRIGAHIDPSYAGFGQETVSIKVVTGSGLTSEAGFKSSNDTDRQREARLRLAFEAQQEAVLKEITQHPGGVQASIDNACKLISHGHISQGIDMVEFLAKATRTSGGIPLEGLLRVMDSLAMPDVQQHIFRDVVDCNRMEMLKRLGNLSSMQRTREAEQLYTVIKRSIDGGDLGTQRGVLQKAFARLMTVHLGAGYEAALGVPDHLYDRMHFEDVQPNVRIYNTTLMALGLTTRMAECDSLWSWLRFSSGVRLPLSSFRAMLSCYAEAERFVDVERLFFDMRSEEVLPDAESLDTLARSYYNFSRHAGGTLPAVEEKKLIFIPTYARQCGVHLQDLSPKNQQLISAAIERWTYKRGLEKTVRHVLDSKKHEYEAWCEGQRWQHISQDELNTSMIEAGIRKLRGDQIDERMRLDVQKGGGRGVIYPPATMSPVTRYDGHFGEEKKTIAWDRIGSASSLTGGRPVVPPTAEAVSRRLASTRQSKGEKRGSGSAWSRR